MHSLYGASFAEVPGPWQVEDSRISDTVWDNLREGSKKKRAVFFLFKDIYSSMEEICNTDLVAHAKLGVPFSVLEKVISIVSKPVGEVRWA